MKEKKYIDRLYQEKFKDFEEVPREDVWKAISNKLQEKEQEKPLIGPFWTRIAGIAALLTLILLLGDWFTSTQTNSVVDTNEEEVQNDNFFPFLFPYQESRIAETDKDQLKKATHDVAAQRKTNPAVASFQKKKNIKKASSIIASGYNPFASTSLFPVITFANDKEKEREVQLAATTPKKEKSVFDEIHTPYPDEKSSSGLSKRKIEIKTQAAPIFYGNIGKGNFIDPQFNDNNSEGEVTYSYGMNIAYAISEKFAIRSGINKVSMSFNTNDIAYHSVLNPSAISNINYNRDNIHFELNDASSRGKNAPQAGGNRSSIGNILPGFLNQKLGFIEVPVEIEYNLIARKFEVKLIGGASTLFLDENIISINAGDLHTNLGEANNLNTVSFSTNIGVGVDYNLSRKFKVNLEPMFKYQINTFNSVSGDAQPYYLGIYSGFSFKF